MNGLAVTILVGQLPKLFGFSVEGDSFLDEVTGFLQGLVEGATVPPALAVGAIGLGLILTLQRAVPKIPAVLVVVVLSTAAASLFRLGARRRPCRHAAPRLPPVHRPRHRPVRRRAASGGSSGHHGGLARGHHLDSLVLRRAHRPDGQRQPGDDGHRGGEHRGRSVPGLSGQHQWFAHRGRGTGRCQDAGHRARRGGGHHSHPAADSGLLRNLPQPTLAAVVIAASISLADIPGMVRLYRVRRTEFSLSVAAFVGVVALGVLPGIAVAVALSIGNVFRRDGGRTRRSSAGRRESPDITMSAATPARSGLRDA